MPTPSFAARIRRCSPEHDATADFAGNESAPCRRSPRRAFATGLVLMLLAASAHPDDAPTPPGPASTLDTVVVSGRKLNIETQIDRKVYTVSEDALTTFGTASDILNVIPSVDIDGDGVVSLRGDSNVLVLIDGKPSSQFQGSAAGENLQSLAATDIERIEVLTTPPPQYKAEGAAGVINIITRKRRPRGTSGSVQGSLGTDTRYVAASRVSYSGARGSTSVNAGFRQDYRDRQVSSEVVGPDPATGQVLYNRSGFSEQLRRQVPSLGVAVDYALSDRESLGGSASWTKRGGLRTYVQENSSANAAGVETSSTGRLSRGHDPENDYDASLRFTQQLQRPGETLELSAHRSVSEQHEHYDYTNQSFVPAAPDYYSDLDFVEDHRITEAGADYVSPLSKTRTVKLGYAFERDDYGFRNAGATVDPITGLPTVDPALTNDFRFQQWIHAVYGSYQATVGGWTWLAGMRAEWTANDALLVTDGSRASHRYFDLFPSLHIDHPVNDQVTLSLGAGRRIARPDPYNLNPYVDHEYTPNLSAGNPDLRPQITQSVDLGIEVERRGASYQVTSYYRRNTNSVTDLVTYLGNGFSLTTKENLPRNDSAGLEFTASAQLTRWLAYSASGNAFYTQIDATQLGTPGLRSTTGVNLKLKIDIRPTARDSLQATLSRTDKRLTAQGTVSAINLVNIGYKRMLSADLSLVATLSDVFNGQRLQRYTATPTLTQDYRRTVAGRIGYVGVVYAFGAARKDKQANFEYDPGG